MQIELVYILQVILILTGLILVFFFKSTLLKIILMVFWYPLVPMYLFCLGVPLGGSLDVIGRRYHEPYCDIALNTAIVGYYLFLVVLWGNRKKILLVKRLKWGEEYRLFLVLVLLAVSIIAYPKAFGIGSARWGLIPGPWPVIFIVMNTLLLLSHKSLRSVSSMLHVVIVLLSMFGGERANSVLVLVTLFIVEPTSDLHYIKERTFKKTWILGGAVLFVAATAVGYTRGGTSITVARILHNIFAQHTATDVIHIYFSSFYYIDNNGLNLLPLINEIMSFVPLSPLGGAGHEFNFTEILRGNGGIDNYGGGLFYTEGVVLMGKVGVFVYSVLYGVFIRSVFSSKKQLGAIIVFLLVTQQMRIQWYGLVYAYSPIILTVLIVGLMNVLKVLFNKVSILSSVE